MPIFKQDFILEAARNVKVFFEVRMGIVRSGIPVPEAAEERERLAARDREISRLKARLAAGGGAPAGGGQRRHGDDERGGAGNRSGGAHQSLTSLRRGSRCVPPSLTQRDG